MAELFTVTKEINGKKYTGQFNGVYACAVAQEENTIEGTEVLSNVLYGKYLLENVLVKPRMTFEDFDKLTTETVKTKVIDGEEYTAQFKGIETALKSIDESFDFNKGKLSNIKFYQFILDNIIVKPEKLKIDDFKNTKVMNEVIAFGREVMGGEALDEYNAVIGFLRGVAEGDFREEANGNTAKAKGTE